MDATRNLQRVTRVFGAGMLALAAVPQAGAAFDPFVVASAEAQDVVLAASLVLLGLGLALKTLEMHRERETRVELRPDLRWWKDRRAGDD